MRPEERDAAYLWDMLDATRSILEFTREASSEDFLGDDMLQAAVERKLEIVGEAARNISEAFRTAHPELPWRRMIGQRNIIAHQYGAVQQERLWAVVEDDLPALITSLERLIPPLPEDTVE